AGSTTTSLALNVVSIGRGKGASFADTELDGIAEAVQVTTENGVGAPPGWNDAFVPTAQVTGSKNELVAMPVTAGEEAWEILKTLAAAELAMVGITESGMPYYRDRTWFSTPPQTTSSETITTLDSITGIQLTEDVDSVRNHWVIHGNPPQVGLPTEDVWSLTDYVSVPAGGAKTIRPTLESPAA